MSNFSWRQAITTIVVLLVIGLGLFGIVIWYKNTHKVPDIPIAEITKPNYEIIGKSVENRKIEAFTYGQGSKKVLFVGGIHGGYEWNSVLLAYNFLDYLDANPNFVPNNLSITVIPSANPDGVFKVVGKEGRFKVTDVPTNIASTTAGRFNAHGVDLNRNFDCHWAATGTWQGKTVSAGTAVFSEPEAVALRDYILKNKPDAVIFWHSQANAVYASQCQAGILPGTIAIMNSYALAAGYSAVKTFDSYVVNGAAEDWLASIGIPAITVELKTHEAIEWDKNLLGIKALLASFSI